jgi:type II secretion system protein H
MRGIAQRGFTMIEIMIVVAIMGIVMATGIPLIYHSVRKDPMRKAISDVMEACYEARSTAIMQGTPAELVIRPRDYTLSINASVDQGNSAQPGVGMNGSMERPAPRKQRPPFNATLSDELIIEMVDVNLREFKDEEEARVCFFPNGTSDEFTLILQWKGSEWRKISLEVVTGLPNLEIIR